MNTYYVNVNGHVWKAVATDIVHMRRILIEKYSQADIRVNRANKGKIGAFVGTLTIRKTKIEWESAKGGKSLVRKSGTIKE